MAYSHALGVLNTARDQEAQEARINEQLIERQLQENRDAENARQQASEKK